MNSLNHRPAAKISWPSPADEQRLDEGEVHVWAASLEMGPADLGIFSAALSADEKHRAARFKFDIHRNRFIAARGSLRMILARYLQTRPAQLDFVYSSHGKPALAGEFSDAGVHFNLAHSENLALAAVTRIAAVGVDVECVRTIRNADELVARFFSPRESELFQNVSTEEKPAAFFNLWTRKEALLKATGEGITQSLRRYEVSFLPGEPARLLAVAGDSEKAARWNLRELAPAPGFAGALALQAQDIRVQCLEFSDTPATSGRCSPIS